MKKINPITFCKDLYKIHRSITGDGILKSLKYIQKHIPVHIHKVKSGEKVFDWTVPEEWNINEAYIIDLESNKRLVSFSDNYLHVLGYSEPVNKKIDFTELDKHLYYSKEVPDGIPYKTSYYKKRWGFCMSYKQYKKLNKKSKYHVFIDSEFNPKGNLNYGKIYSENNQLVFKGKFNFNIRNDEEFFRTFQVQKKNRLEIQNFFFDLEYNLFEKEFKITSLKLNNLDVEENNIILDFLNDYNIENEIKNWIDLKNFINKILIAYEE